MANLARVIGTKSILSNLKRAEVRLAVKTLLALKAAGLYLQGESQRLVPVDTGNLKASAFTRVSGTTVTVGYTASYALFVHEAVGMKLKGQPRTTKGRYWDPQGRAQAKFLEEPARTKRVQMRRIIKSVIGK